MRFELPTGFWLPFLVWRRAPATRPTKKRENARSCREKIIGRIVLAESRGKDWRAWELFEVMVMAWRGGQQRQSFGQEDFVSRGDSFDRQLIASGGSEA